MINKEIIKLASNYSNVGLGSRYSHRISMKNSMCGDKITLELLTDNKKINSMKYETESCIYCEASASLLSKNIKNLSIKDIKKNFNAIKKNAQHKKVKIPKKFISFKRLINSDNFSRYKCIFLPFDAVLKALKL